MFLGSLLLVSPVGCTGGSATTNSAGPTSGDAVGADGTSRSLAPDGAPLPTDTAGGDGGSTFPEVIWTVPEDSSSSGDSSSLVDGQSPEDASQTPTDDSSGTEVGEDTTSPPTDADATVEPVEDVVPVSPCEGVVCEPPAAVCEGLDLVSWSGGTCVLEDNEPSCVFDTTTTECHEQELGVCADGACGPCTADDQCANELVPGPFCPNELVAHSGVWECKADGLCGFEGPMSQCTGVSWAVCEGDKVQWYANQCVEGVGCTDIPIEHEEATDCGAQGLICVDLQFPQCADPTDTCDVGTDCIQFPSNACKNLDLLQTYEEGTCFSTTEGPGICVYLPTYVSCQDAGEICGPDACVIPPWPPAPCDTASCIQWAPEDGGNGHWYELVTENAPLSWDNASALAQEKGGHLAAVSTAAESVWVYLNLASGQVAWSGSDGPWLGGFQDTTADDYGEPDGAWTWVTGEPFDDAAWYPGEPNNSGESNHLQYYNALAPSPTWGDGAGAASHAFVVEYPYP